MEDLLESKNELLKLAQGCTSNYKHNVDGSSFVYGDANRKISLTEETEILPSVIGSENIKLTADCMIKAISAVTYKIGTLAENLDTKLSQLSDTIMFLEQDVSQIQVQISHAIDGGYQKEFRETYGQKAKMPRLERCEVNKNEAARLSNFFSNYESKAIDYDILDKITTANLKANERKRTESFKEAYENIFNPQTTNPCMSIRNSVSNQDKFIATGSPHRLKKVDIPLMAFEVPEKKSPPPVQTDNTYVNLNELDESTDTYAAFDKLLLDMSKETEILDTNYMNISTRESLPLPPPPEYSEYSLIENDSDEEMPPPLPNNVMVPNL
ncbi:uncharacterized protein [Lepeophtheirus salmonis]|nr:uncharacterized protein LOC121119374 [Lepeophtheirus salmonis]